MRIGLDASLAAGGGGGSARYASLLLPRLLALDEADEFVLYVRSKELASHPLRAAAGPRVQLRAVDAPHPLLRIHLGLGRALRRDRVDVYHALAYFTPLTWRGKSVVTVHDIHPLLLREHWWWRGSRRAYLVMQAHIRLGIGRARFVVTPSAYTRDTVLARFPIPPDRVVVAAPAADPRFAEPPRPEDLDRAAARAGPAPFFLYVGVLAPQKNPAGLLRALARVRAGGASPAPRLLLVGRSVGRYWERVLVPLIRDLGLEAAVTGTGYIDDALLLGLYHRAAALVLPSFGEGFGLPVLEAMACGTPVIAAATSALPEVGGDAALYVDPRDPADIGAAMARVLSAPGLREDLGSRGRARAAAFSWERCARRVLECYRG